MKESLDLESRDSLIAYRIERAYGSLKEAKGFIMHQSTGCIMLVIIWLLPCS